MKTPTMLYLAYHGWFTANVPLVEDLPLPDGLLAVPANRVFCLFVSPARLLELRRVRAEREAIPAAFYATQERVATGPAQRRTAVPAATVGAGLT